MKYKKCKIGEYCEMLKSKLENTNETIKGIVPITVVNLKTFEDRHVGLCYRKSTTDKGLILNFCPFCGEKIYEELPLTVMIPKCPDKRISGRGAKQ